MKLPTYLLFLKRPLVLLLLYVSLSFYMMSLNDDETLSGVRWLLLQTVEWVNGVEEFFAIRAHLADENELLKEDNYKLRSANENLRELLLENIRLRRLLKLQENRRFDYTAAKVIGKDIQRGIQSLLLSVGTDDSVRKNMAVVNADGLIGKLLAVTPGQSVVQILKDHNSLVSARLQHSRESGVVAWAGNAWLDLKFIPKNIRVEPGELVVTSGLSQIYPPGIKIGIVTSIEENEYDLFKRIKLKPAVNFNAIEEVFIIQRAASEADSLE